MSHCVFCAHRAKDGADSPVGRICATCAIRIATIARLGGSLVTTCWGVEIQSSSGSALELLVEQELAALGGEDGRSRRRLEAAEVHLREGHAAQAVIHAAMVLVWQATGPTAERALALLLGPMLKPNGADALRAALFRA